MQLYRGLKTYVGRCARQSRGISTFNSTRSNRIGATGTSWCQTASRRNIPPGKRLNHFLSGQPAQLPPQPYTVPFYRYERSESRWKPLQHGAGTRLDNRDLLTIISWNINFPRPDPRARTRGILRCLEDTCAGQTARTIIMLQEVLQESLDVILEDSWIRQHFNLSNIASPDDLIYEILGETFVMRCMAWEAGYYFTMMMVSTDLSVVNTFRAPFATEMGRDALGADLLLASPSDRRNVLRVCTTHLESSYEGTMSRPVQLQLISDLLKTEPTPNSDEPRIAAGIVGGDMNSFDNKEHAYPTDVGLKDAWEQGPEQELPVLKPFQRDLSNGLARGNTFGYQAPNGKRLGKRPDKILFSGALDYIPYDAGDQVTRGLKRLGVELKTNTEAYEYQSPSQYIERGRVKEKMETKHITKAMRERMQKWTSREVKLVNVPAWLSDHYGLMARFRLQA